MLATLVVDDERRAVDLLRKLLEETGEFSSVRHAYSATSAIDAVRVMVPDIIFLDIQMPNKDGFEFLKELKELNIESYLVIVTAYDQYKLEALRAGVLDYLTKPIIPEDLRSCIERFKKYVKGGKNNFNLLLSQILGHFEKNQKVRFDGRSDFYMLEPSDIFFCEADGNYSKINSVDGPHLCSLNLGQVEKKLPMGTFVRLGRSIIINIRFVRKVDRKSGNVTLEKNGRRVDVALSRRQIAELDKLLK